MNSTQDANAERHYILLTLAIFIGLAGVYLRFLGDAPIFSIAANIIMVIGAVFSLWVVFRIIK